MHLRQVCWKTWVVSTAFGQSWSTCLASTCHSYLARAGFIESILCWIHWCSKQGMQWLFWTWIRNLDKIESTSSLAIHSWTEYWSSIANHYPRKILGAPIARKRCYILLVRKSLLCGVARNFEKFVADMAYLAQMGFQRHDSWPLASTKPWHACYSFACYVTLFFHVSVFLHLTLTKDGSPNAQQSPSCGKGHEPSDGIESEEMQEDSWLHLLNCFNFSASLCIALLGPRRTFGAKWLKQHKKYAADNKVPKNFLIFEYLVICFLEFLVLISYIANTVQSCKNW